MNFVFQGRNLFYKVDSCSRPQQAKVFRFFSYTFKTSFNFLKTQQQPRTFRKGNVPYQIPSLSGTTEVSPIFSLKLFANFYTHKKKKNTHTHTHTHTHTDIAFLHQNVDQ